MNSNLEFIKNLQEALNEVSIINLDRKDGTKELRKCVAFQSRQAGYRPIPEYPAGNIDNRNAYIDFVCTQRRGFNQGSSLAIEIDSSNKIWSLTKLLEMKNRGFDCVWIRWNAQIRVIPSPGIYLIDLT
jgi:hypothetical protein